MGCKSDGCSESFLLLVKPRRGLLCRLFRPRYRLVLQGVVPCKSGIQQEDWRKPVFHWWIVNQDTQRIVDKFNETRRNARRVLHAYRRHHIDH